MKKIKMLVYMSFLIAMYVLLNHVVPFIQVETIRVSFGFVPQALASMLFGPAVGAVGSAAGDVIGMAVAPKGPYFPGFTLSALLTGLIYGLFLYKKPKSLVRIILAVLTITLLVDIGLNTYWLTLLYGHGFFAILPARIIKSAIMLPVQAAVLALLWNYAGNRIEKMLTNSSA